MTRIDRYAQMPCAARVPHLVEQARAELARHNMRGYARLCQQIWAEGCRVVNAVEELAEAANRASCSEVDRALAAEYATLSGVARKRFRRRHGAALRRAGAAWCGDPTASARRAAEVQEFGRVITH